MRTEMLVRLRNGLLGFAAGALVVAAPAARADFVPTGYAAGSQQFGLSMGGAPHAGGFQGTWDGNPIVFWCVELTQYFSFGTHYSNYTPSLATSTLLSQLFTEAYSAATTNATHSAAFQLAIWEIIYDSGDLHLNSGTFRVLNNMGHAATVALAQSFLDGLAGTSASYALNFLRNPNNQDFVTASRIPAGNDDGNKVPEPGTMALLAAAALAAAFARGQAGRRALTRRRCPPVN